MVTVLLYLYCIVQVSSADNCVVIYLICDSLNGANKTTKFMHKLLHYLQPGWDKNHAVH